MQITDESLEDTLLDNAVYSLLILALYGEDSVEDGYSKVCE